MVSPTWLSSTARIRGPACALPVAALGTLMGGIDPVALTAAFLIAGGLTVLGCALALALSVWMSLSGDDSLDRSNPSWLRPISLGAVILAPAQLLGAMAGLGASLAIPSVYALGQDARPASPRIIDTHHHHLPPKVALEKRAALVGMDEDPRIN